MINLDLTAQTVEPLTVRGTDQDGDPFEIRFEFKERLNRQQSMTMTKTIGKGKKAREIPDLDRLYRRTIRSIHLILGFNIKGIDGEPLPMDRPIEDPDQIVRIMNVMPTEISDPVDSRALGTTELEVDEKNS